MKNILLSISLFLIIYQFQYGNSIKINFLQNSQTFNSQAQQQSSQLSTMQSSQHTQTDSEIKKNPTEFINDISTHSPIHHIVRIHSKVQSIAQQEPSYFEEGSALRSYFKDDLNEEQFWRSLRAFSHGIFQMLDCDNSGFVEKDEFLQFSAQLSKFLVKLYGNVASFDSEQAEKFFTQLNGGIIDNKISFEEFFDFVQFLTTKLIKRMSRNIESQKRNIEAKGLGFLELKSKINTYLNKNQVFEDNDKDELATFFFNFFDCNDNGFVSVQQINKFLTSFKPLFDLLLEFVVDKFDKNHDGKLNFKEFKNFGEFIINNLTG